jgi:hypothetical protein
MSNKPPGPLNPFPCGGINDPPCPPEPAVVIDGVKYFTDAQIREHAHNSYRKGVADCSVPDAED